MRVVLDSNVLVSALVGRSGPRRLLLRLIDTHTIISSTEMFAELEGVLSRDKFRFNKRHVEEYLSLIAAGSIIVEIGDPPQVVEEDPDDNVVLATAVRGSVDYLVTGDRHLLKLREYCNAKIVTVREMLAILKE